MNTKYLSSYSRDEYITGKRWVVFTDGAPASRHPFVQICAPRQGETSASSMTKDTEQKGHLHMRCGKGMCGYDESNELVRTYFIQ